ncbi:PhnD/SsuA/transferrin family substrate-binding protein [Vibrio sp. SCSIO 43136]|uniref:phosphate/phosphite/phosphonate ABC transporter substrate-binding protein n=1 Tax=Vibrio sp. SCSIO 43136 TaxID=2819101 RepID=UPI00207581B8|nr:PhnD/SsuA/transferrin family substrate-binding protein [Vibrio sp. SCSIO 43136]USD63967.1 PhnD/SsuA/transferrin family substrate-binding protein [Vibrio sp. SCSIO 43136]
MNSLASSLCKYIIAALLCFPISTFALENGGQTFTIAVISNKAKKRIGEFMPLSSYLSEKSQALGFTNANVVVTEDISQIADLVNAGKVHLIAATPYSGLLLEHRHIATPTAKYDKNSLASYHSVFFCKQRAPIHQLSDLKGKTLLFERRLSTSAYFQPMLELIRHGIPVEYLSDIHQGPKPDTVGYRFIQDELAMTNEINMSLWVDSGIVDAAAFSNENWLSDREMPNNMRKQMKIFHRSFDLPRALLLAPNSNTKALNSSIHKAFDTLKHEPNGREILNSLQNSQYIKPLSPKDREQLDVVRRHLPTLLKLNQ